jgi:hypothetical protein
MMLCYNGTDLPARFAGRQVAARGAKKLKPEDQDFVFWSLMAYLPNRPFETASLCYSLKKDYNEIERKIIIGK